MLLDDDILVSIIVPVYKVEKYLGRCIDSLIAQTYKTIEIILVDDGSPDKCPGICDKYALTDDRIKVIHKENGGLSDARNAGIEAATGEYLMFVDGDDYISPDMTEKLYLALKKNDADMSICNFVCVNEDGSVYDGKMWEQIQDGLITGRDVLEIMLTGDYVTYVIACNKLYKRQIFQSIRFPQGKIHEDDFVAHYLFGMCDRVACIKDACYFYLQREGSIIHKEDYRGKMNGLQALADRIVYCEARGFKEALGKAYLVLALLFSKLYCERKDNDNLKDETEMLHQKVRELFYLRKYCTFKERAHLWMVYISPDLYQFFLRVIHPSNH